MLRTHPVRLGSRVLDSKKDVQTIGAREPIRCKYFFSNRASDRGYFQQLFSIFMHCNTFGSSRIYYYY